MSFFRLHIVLLFFMFICSHTVRAQQHSLTDSIKNLVKQAVDENRRFNHQQAGFKKFELAEKLAKSTGNPMDLLLVYRQKAFVFYSNKDSINSHLYLEKTKQLFNYCKDSLEIGLCYELFGVLETQSIKKLKYYEKARKLLVKYGKPENLIYINFNLANYYRSIKNWKQTIEYSLLSLKAIRESGKNERTAKYLYVYILESYTALGDYKNAKGTLITLDSIRSKPNFKNNLFFDINYCNAAANYYYNIGSYKKAADLRATAQSSDNKLRMRQNARIGKSMLIENELNLKKEALKRSNIENQLKETKLNASLIFIVFMSSLLLFVSIFAFQQNRSAKKIKEINLALEKQNANLENVTKELEKALKAKTDFLNVMTHELFTPINGIAIIIHNLKTKGDNKKFSESLDLLEFSSNYLYQLLKNIMDTKSIEENENIVLNRDPVSLKSIIKAVSQTAEIFLKTSTNTFQYFIDIKLPNILLIDRIMLSQILINLLNNANKYTSNGKITLSVELEAETDTKAKVLFKIADTGIGIEEESIKVIFEKFQHGSEAIKQKYGGSGMGLYVVKHFLSLHDSNIKVDSEKGKGTTFIFSIWFDKVNNRKTKSRSGRQQLTGSILLVDDNKINLMVTKKILESGFFECDTVDNGFEAIEALRKTTYDLILMDILMPGMNGFETTRHIKQLNINTPVVALTTVNEEENKVEFEKAEFAATISKPIKPDNLFKTIRSTLLEWRKKLQQRK